MPKTVAIVGVSGFSGAELARLVAADPDLQLTSAYSDRMRGGTVAGGVVVRPQSDAAGAGEEAEVVALATPAEVSAELAPRLLAKGARVLDLSGAFRLPDPAVFRAYYRFEHPEPALLGEAHYGLPQLPKAAGDAPAIREARLIANPGCYATAAILALAPLATARLLDDGPVFVDGKSGVTGAGRKLAERYLFTEVAENVSLYRVVDHQHVPEIELALERVSGKRLIVTFAPHLLPIRRGLITTCFGRLAAGVDPAAVAGAHEAAFAGAAPIVRVTPIDELSVQAVAYTAEAHVGAKVDARGGVVVAACAIDNLLKGAASQAWENLRRMCGLAARLPA